MLEATVDDPLSQTWLVFSDDPADANADTDADSDSSTVPVTLTWTCRHPNASVCSLAGSDVMMLRSYGESTLEVRCVRALVCVCVCVCVFVCVFMCVYCVDGM